MLSIFFILINISFINDIKVPFFHWDSHVLHIEMQSYKEEEEEIERLVSRLVEGVTEDVKMDNDQGKTVSMN